MTCGRHQGLAGRARRGTWSEASHTASHWWVQWELSLASCRTANWLMTHVARQLTHVLSATSRPHEANSRLQAVRPPGVQEQNDRACEA